MEGGSEFDVLEGIKEGYQKWHNYLKKGFDIAAAAGIFIPVVGTIAAAVYGVAMVVALPAIPLINVVRGAIKNATKQYKDKTEFNRSKEVNNINEQIFALLQIHSSLNEKQFEDAYSKIISNIYSLSATTCNNDFVVNNGDGKVNANNVNLANQYIKKYNAINSKVEFYSKKIESLKAKGKEVPESIQTKYDNLLLQLDQVKNTNIVSSYNVDPNFEPLKFKASSLKFYYYITRLNGDELDNFLNEIGLTEAFKESRISYDVKFGLTLDGISLFADEKQIKQAFNDGATIEAWKNVREMILSAVNKVSEPKNEGPASASVEELSATLHELETIYKDCVAELNVLLEISDEYEIKQHLNAKQINLQAMFEKLYLSATKSYSVKEIRAKIDEISAKKELLSEFKSEVEETVQAIASIENSISQCNSIFEEIRLYDLAETQFGVEFNSLKKDVGKIENAVKSNKKLELIKTQNESMKENVNRVTELLDLIKAKTIDADKQLLNDNIVKYYNSAIERIESLNSTKVKTILTGLMSILRKNLLEIKEFENQTKLKETSREQAVELRNKVQLIYNLIDVGVKSMMVLENLIKENSPIEVQAVVGRLLAEMAELIRVNSSMTVEELKLKLAKAQLKYEHEISLYKSQEKVSVRKAEKKVKKSEPKTFDAKINSEDTLVQILVANKESKSRKNLIAHIKKQSGVDISEEDIVATIKAIDRRHKNNRNARAGAHNYANKNICIILDYGQEYLTKHAIEIKEQIVRDL